VTVHLLDNIINCAMSASHSNVLLVDGLFIRSVTYVACVRDSCMCSSVFYDTKQSSLFGLYITIITKQCLK